jgi:hypothetical protein
MRSRLRGAATRLRFAVPALLIGLSLSALPFPTCILRLSVDVPCPACGLTRAALALARLDLAAATSLNPLAIPLALVAIGAVIGAAILDQNAWNWFVKNVGSGSAVALVVVWASRFVGIFGGPVAP